MIEEIRQKIAQGQFEFSRHAVDQSIIQRISVRDLRQAIATGEIIEDYPDDKYGPSCLVLGFTPANRPVQVPQGGFARQVFSRIKIKNLGCSVRSASVANFASDQSSTLKRGTT